MAGRGVTACRSRPPAGPSRPARARTTAVPRIRLRDLPAPARAVPSDSAIHVTVLQQGRYSHLLYTVNQEPLTGATLKALLNRYPPAAAELRKGRAQLRWGLALIPVMVAAFLVSKHQADRESGQGSAFSKAPVPVSLL